MNAFEIKNISNTKYISKIIQKNNDCVTLKKAIENMYKMCYILITGCDICFISKRYERMKYMLKNNKGITLIALVVSIIVLLILAGISINMLTGENGILNRAAEAKKKTEDSTDLEYLQTKAYEGVTDYYINGKNGSETEYILSKLSELDGVTTNIVQGTVEYKGKIYNISEIVGNSTEQKEIEKAGLTQITTANAKDDKDKEMLAETDEDGNAKIRYG